MVLAACTNTAGTSTTTSPDTASSSSTMPATTPSTTDAEPESVFAGLAAFGGLDETVVLVTPFSDNGVRPLLSWEPVDGADRYGVYVYAPNGRAYWSWTGSVTSVHVGGDPQLRDGAPGPTVSDGMTWAVVAYDADVLPIAVSELRAISP